MERIQASKKNPCKFGSLLVCLFFYVQNYFPTIGDVTRRKRKLVTQQITKFIYQLGDNFEKVVDGYFEEFKKNMKSTSRIPNVGVS